MRKRQILGVKYVVKDTSIEFIVRISHKIEQSDVRYNVYLVYRKSLPSGE